MAKKEEMEIEIDEDGKVSIRVTGVAGKECIDVSRFLEEALGDEISRKLTTEYYKEEETTQEEEQIKRKRS